MMIPLISAKSFKRSSSSLWTLTLQFVIFTISAWSYASPIPGTGSSLLVAPEAGLFWQRQGFRLKTAQTGWRLGSPESEMESKQVRYLPPQSQTGSLVVQAEVLKTEQSIENYAKKWMKDYSSYGFDVLATSTISQNGTRGLVIDLFHRKSDQQMRQILFLKEKKAVVLTCRDRQRPFQKTVLGCNQIARTFAWVTQ